MSRSDFGTMSEMCNEHIIDEQLIATYLEKYRVLDNLKDKGQTIHFLFNYNKLKLEFLSKNVEEVTGKKSSYFKVEGEELLKRIFREDDVNFFINIIPKEFQELRKQYSGNDIERLSFQIFTRISKDLCGGRNKLFQYKVVEADEFNKPLLCYGWVTEVSFAVEPQYISIATNYMKNGNNEVVFHKKFNYSDELLSNREVQVVRLIVKGFTSQEVADELIISVKTVNNHRQNILRKLDAKSTSEVVKYAVLHGHF